MCGIASIVVLGHRPADVRESLARMEKAQLHRGPDDQGTLVEELGNGLVVGLGHQRLSILDLSMRGHQPMESPCGRYVLIYNGEIYNYEELAQELKNDPILDISPGDTAVVLAAIARWGFNAFAKFNGMWAIVCFDRFKKRLFISRDRMGVKPLYCYRDSHQLIFASEIKAILAVCGKRLELNIDVVARFLFQSLTDTLPQSFFKGIDAIPPASCAVLDLSSTHGVPEPEFQPFWTHPFKRSELNFDDADVEPSVLRALLTDAVRIRLRSDVPVGILLSGGIDSSSILAAAKTADRLDSLVILSVVSSDAACSEERFIDEMAKHAECSVVKVKVDADPLTVLDDLDRACWYSDQPVGGLSAVCHRYLMQRARELGVTVVLTGQGADEQLGGYNKYFYFYLLELFRHGHFGKAAAMLGGSIFHRTVLQEFTFSEAKRYLPFLLQRNSNLYAGTSLRDARLAITGLTSSFQEREYLDMRYFSVPMLLHYEDRMSMSCSREVRVPFLDYRIVEYLAKVPTHHKLRNGWTKALLRDAIAGMVPDSIRWRRDKKGFDVPEKLWARTILRDRFRERFGDDMLAAKLGFVNPGAVRALYARYVAGDPFVAYKDIFEVYCLETWLRVFEHSIAMGQSS